MRALGFVPSHGSSCSVLILSVWYDNTLCVCVMTLLTYKKNCSLPLFFRTYFYFLGKLRGCWYWSVFAFISVVLWLIEESLKSWWPFLLWIVDSNLADLWLFLSMFTCSLLFSMISFQNAIFLIFSCKKMNTFFFLFISIAVGFNMFTVRCYLTNLLDPQALVIFLLVSFMFNVDCYILKMLVSLIWPNLKVGLFLLLSNCSLPCQDLYEICFFFPSSFLLEC